MDGGGGTAILGRKAGGFVDKFRQILTFFDGFGAVFGSMRADSK
jgi:hypothetical protein